MSNFNNDSGDFSNSTGNFNNVTENFNNPLNPEEFNTNSSNYTPPQIEKPPKKPKVLFIVLAVIVVLLAGSITAFACVPSISNQVYLTVLSPKNYYLKIEKKAIDSMVDFVSSSYGKQVEQIQKTRENPKTVSTNIKLSLNDDYISMLGLSDVLPLELKTTSSIDLKNNKEKLFGELLLANESFGSMNILTDISTENYGSFYIQIPELSENYIGCNSSELVDEASSEEMEATEKAKTFYLNYLAEPTSEKLLKTLLSRYSNIIINNLNTVTLEKNADVSANDVTVKNTKIVVTITSEEMKNIFKEIIDTAKNDTDLKNELIRLETCTEEEYNTFMENAAAQVEEIDASSEDQLLMTVWVDKNGNITGREFTTETTDDEPVTLAYHTAKDKNITNFEYSQTADGVTNLIVKGKNTTEKGISNGDITAELGGGGSTNYSAEITYDSVTQTNKELGYFSGNFNLSIAQIPSASLKITATGTDKDQTLLYEAIAFGANVGSLEITTAEADFEDFTFPSSEKVYHINNSEEMNNYMSTVNEDYTTKISNKVNEISKNFYQILEDLGIFDGSDGPTAIFPAVPSDDDAKSDSNETNENSTDRPNDESNSKEDENNLTEQISDGFTINENPQTKEDLPSDAEVDENGYYSYELTDEQVMENGEPSDSDTFYSQLIFTDIKDDLYKMLTKEISVNWEDCETSSYNVVNGTLGDESSLYKMFLTTSAWKYYADSSYKSFSVSYDTYSKEVSEFAISGDSKKEIFAILKNLLALTEENFSNNDFTTIKKKLEQTKKGDYTLYDFGNSRIYYSISDDGSCYCTIDANN